MSVYALESIDGLDNPSAELLFLLNSGILTNRERRHNCECVALGTCKERTHIH
jgi:hypothetical protein